MAIEAINPTTGEAVRYDEHGLPRNVEQAELLQPHVKIERIIHLACDDEDLLAERIRGRNTGRQDDANVEVIRHRFDVYREQTVALFEHFPEHQISAVDAMRTPLAVLQQIVGTLN